MMIIKKTTIALAFICILILLIPIYSTVAAALSYQNYLPVIQKYPAPTPTPTPLLTATPITPTSTPAPGAPPKITYFNCIISGPPYNYLLSCFLDVQNVGDRPISDVVIKIYYDGLYRRSLSSGSYWIQPGNKYTFVWTDTFVSPPTEVSASIDSWIVH
jgi:hypothetical protein